MKNQKQHFVVLVLVIALVCTAGTVLAAPVLIVHPGVPADGLSASQVKMIYLGKTAQWDDGARIRLATLSGGDLAKEFLAAYVKKTPSQFSTFWKKAVFSGTGEMPASFGTEAELVAFVASTPGAVGFVDEATTHEGVTVVPVN